MLLQHMSGAVKGMGGEMRLIDERRERGGRAGEAR